VCPETALNCVTPDKVNFPGRVGQTQEMADAASACFTRRASNPTSVRGSPRGQRERSTRMKTRVVAVISVLILLGALALSSRGPERT
jgi:hypothetical protein